MDFASVWIKLGLQSAKEARANMVRVYIGQGRKHMTREEEEEEEKVRPCLHSVTGKPLRVVSQPVTIGILGDVLIFPSWSMRCAGWLQFTCWRVRISGGCMPTDSSVCVGSAGPWLH
jgi:hypothetical protein